jgi:hypothetical protein
VLSLGEDPFLERGQALQVGLDLLDEVGPSFDRSLIPAL